MPRPRQTTIEQLIRLLREATPDELLMAQGAIRALAPSPGRKTDGNANATLDLREEEVSAT